MEEVDAEPEDELWTLIRHRKGELRAPGRCERDMCPRERKARRGVYIRPIRNNQPICHIRW